MSLQVVDAYVLSDQDLQVLVLPTDLVIMPTILPLQLNYFLTDFYHILIIKPLHTIEYTGEPLCAVHVGKRKRETGKVFF